MLVGERGLGEEEELTLGRPSASDIFSASLDDVEILGGRSWLG